MRFDKGDFSVLVYSIMLSFYALTKPLPWWSFPIIFALWYLGGQLYYLIKK